MEIRNSFVVDAPPERVYEMLVDLERVGPAIPGATIGAAREDGAHPAQIVVKLGPMRMTYAGTVRIVDRDDAEGRAVLAADVKEARGQGNARARMTMQVAEKDRGASVDSLTEVDITGRAAAMGRGIIEDVATRLVGQLAGNLSSQLADEDPAPAASPSDAPPPPAAPSAGGPAPTPAPAVSQASTGSSEVNGFALLLRVLQDRISRLLHRIRRGS